MLLFFLHTPSDAASFVMIPVDPGVSHSTSQDMIKSVLPINVAGSLSFSGKGFKVVTAGDTLRADAYIRVSERVGLRWVLRNYATGQQQVLGRDHQVVWPSHHMLWSPVLPTDQPGIYQLTAELSNGRQISSVHYQVMDRILASQSTYGPQARVAQVSAIREPTGFIQDNALTWSVSVPVQIDNMRPILAYRLEVYATYKPVYFDSLHAEELDRLAPHASMSQLVGVDQGELMLGELGMLRYQSQLDIPQRVLQQPVGLPQQQLFWRVVGINIDGRSVLSSRLQRIAKS